MRNECAFDIPFLEIFKMNEIINLTNDANEYHAKAVDAAGSAVAYAIRCGQKLLEIKGQLPRGEFQNWREQNFNASKATASRYQRFAKNADKLTKAKSMAEAESLLLTRQKSGPSGLSSEVAPTAESIVQDLIRNKDSSDIQEIIRMLTNAANEPDDVDDCEIEHGDITAPIQWPNGYWFFGPTTSAAIMPSEQDGFHWVWTLDGGFTQPMRADSIARVLAISGCEIENGLVFSRRVTPWAIDPCPYEWLSENDLSDCGCGRTAHPWPAEIGWRNWVCDFCGSVRPEKVESEIMDRAPFVHHELRDQLSLPPGTRTDDPAYLSLVG